jgi:hypothetical protein
MSRFRSTKRAKELKRKAKHKAKEERKRERRERAQAGETEDDIDWSQAVGISSEENSLAEPTEPDGESEHGESEP